jgi:hydroxymethylpyrimidine pyrophosphatase-like HAD family hydrolase
MLIRDFPGQITIHQNMTTIDINPVHVDKATGIEEIIRRKDWGGCEVLAIGDGGNDIGMLTRFRGYTVPGADPAVEKAAARVFAGVGEMLDEYLESGDGEILLPA